MNKPTEVAKELELLVGDIIALGTDHPNNPPAPQNGEQAKTALNQFYAEEMLKIVDEFDKSGDSYSPLGQLRTAITKRFGVNDE